jgi:hypothetical protein
VKRKCLDLLGKLGFPDTKVKETNAILQNIIEKFTADDDPRVRSSAFEAMVRSASEIN